MKIVRGWGRKELCFPLQIDYGSEVDLQTFWIGVAGILVFDQGPLMYIIAKRNLAG